MERFIAFDLEIAKEIPEGVDWTSIAPLGITCAATCTSEGIVNVFGSTVRRGVHDPAMDVDTVERMFLYVLEFVKNGYYLVTWNGLAFDLPVWDREMRDDELRARLAEIALNAHIDPAFQMRAEKGYMMSLNTAAEALGVKGKTEGMHGDLAPVMWKKGRAEQDQVLEYVAQDARATADVYRAMVESGPFHWKTKKGTLSYKPWEPKKRDGRLLTCGECAALPKVDTSWMTRQPRSVASYFEWIGAKPDAFVADGVPSPAGDPEPEPDMGPVVDVEPPPGFFDQDVPF